MNAQRKSLEERFLEITGVDSRPGVIARALLTVMHLTLFEAMRRRILLASAISGAAFLPLFGTGLHFVLRDIDKHEAMSLIQRRMFTNFLTLAGLYATNFLLVMTAVLLPVDTPRARSRPASSRPSPRSRSRAGRSCSASGRPTCAGRRVSRACSPVACS